MDQMSYTIGVDYHKRTSTFCVLDSAGKRVKKKRLENRPERLIEFISDLGPGKKHLAYEAGRSWGLLHDTLLPYVDRISLGHPKKMKAITNSETKNDSHDSEMIAQLTHLSFLPCAHISSPEIRQLRSVVRFRGALVNERRSIRNRVQILLDRNVWACERPENFKDPFCSKGIKWMRDLKLPEREKVILEHCIELYFDVEKRIEDIEKMLTAQMKDIPEWKYLRTVPGFRSGGINSIVVLAEVSEIERFNKARSFARYAGLMPKEHSSGDVRRMGRLIKGANMHLRTAFIESTLAAIRSDQGLKLYYEQVKARRGSGAAIVATARKLSMSVFHVLKEKRGYVPEKIKDYPPAADCHSWTAVDEI